ncbi:hypothetical protein [Pseudomonas sp. ZB1P45]|uniref:hypothetical protein n=1 Tax=Pseudomonas frigoris TaxID=3398356 RepID=UPI0039EEDE76
MSLNSKMVLNRYIGLSPEEKNEFIRDLLKHHGQSLDESISLEALGSTINETMITLGPRESRCGVCGRG